MTLTPKHKIIIAFGLSFGLLLLFPAIILPIILSVLIALTLLSPVKWLEKKGVNRFLSALIVMLIVSTLLIGIGFFYGSQFSIFFETLPDISTSSEEAVSELAEQIDEETSININDYKSKIQDGIIGLIKSGGELFTSTISAFTNFFSLLFLIPIYIIFMLLTRDRVVEFTKRNYSATGQHNILAFFNDARLGMLSYFKGLSIVILVVGLLNSVGLMLIGIDYAVLLGSFSALLIVIPYIGVIAGAIIPIAVAILTKESYLYALAVAALYAVIQFLEGNVITPKLMGNEVNLNPLVIIVFLVFMGAIGGLLGLIVAVPLLNLIKIALKHVPELAPWAILLENTSKPQ